MIESYEREHMRASEIEALITDSVQALPGCAAVAIRVERAEAAFPGEGVDAEALGDSDD